MKPVSWKTTLWGIIAAIALGAKVATDIHAGHPIDMPTILQGLGAIGLGGLGIAAADNKNL